MRQLVAATHPEAAAESATTAKGGRASWRPKGRGAGSGTEAAKRRRARRRAKGWRAGAKRRATTHSKGRGACAKRRSAGRRPKGGRACGSAETARAKGGRACSAKGRRAGTKPRLCARQSSAARAASSHQHQCGWSIQSFSSPLTALIQAPTRGGCHGMQLLLTSTPCAHSPCLRQRDWATPPARQSRQSHQRLVVHQTHCWRQKQALTPPRQMRAGCQHRGRGMPRQRAKAATTSGPGMQRRGWGS